MISTTIYEIETADEYGDWHKQLTTRDPMKALGKAAELALAGVSTRQTTLYEKDQEVKPKPVTPLAEKVNTIVGQCAGAVSVCWTGIESAGVFDSTQAAKHVKAAVAEIVELV
ncbi:hypothetical protein SEA_STEVIEBAY_66 [Arthrobacter phage StevieBAY]|uniref:Uncharacterized protein n=1 Tax=Arthrobacter phage StevieBAY TaxID=2725609 RepID=A0A6M3T555_9CAUD|nr:hypothetical protein SEA_STEVIEBAY_66 [Arthrobacter phage StevieBAY]